MEQSGSVLKRSVVAAIMAWSMLTGGGPQSMATNTVKQGVIRLISHESSCRVSQWDGQCISMAAYARVW